MWQDLTNSFFIWADSVLIAPYRILEPPIAGFYLGTFVLCLWCVLIGELTFRLSARMNSRHMNRLRSRAVKMHNLSIKAIVVKDKENYRACNKEANEAFGKYFFNVITQGAAYLWPVPFALGWMSTRWTGLELELVFPFPLIGNSVGYAGVLIPMYILCRIIWGKVRPHLFFFNKAPGMAMDEGEEEMIKWEEINKHQGLPDRFWQDRDNNPQSLER
ncbi:MAG: hypothetical protein ACOCPN_04080 [Desulfonatronovibrionaceae bacterium]